MQNMLTVLYFKNIAASIIQTASLQMLSFEVEVLLWYATYLVIFKIISYFLSLDNVENVEKFKLIDVFEKIWFNL